MVSVVFGADLLHTIFGDSYRGSILPLHLLMLSAPLMALDQVLSQAMQSAKLFRADTISVLVGAFVILTGTIVLGDRWGATGAAFSLLLGLIVILTSRFILLRNLIDAGVMMSLARNPVLAAAVTGIGFWFLHRTVFSGLAYAPAWAWMPLAVLSIGAYLLLLRQFGGLKASKRGRVRQFLLSRHHGAH
jgi:O-antigen/teichoic acid export membrane protein